MSEDDLSSAAAASAEAPSSGREGKPRTVTAPSPGREDTPEPQSVTAPSGESWNIPDSVVAASSRVSEDDLSSIVAAKSASDQGSVASSDSTRPPDNEPDLATAPFSSGSLTLGEIDEPDQGETSPGSITIERPVHNRAWLLAMGGALVLGLGGAGAWVAFGGEQEPASETARAQIDDGPEVRRDASIPGSVDGSSGSAVPAPEPSDEQPSGSSGLSGPDEAPSSSPAARPPVESTTRSSAAKPKATAPDTSPPKTEEPVGSATEAEPATTPAKPKSKSKPKSKPKTDASVRSQLIQKIKKKCRSGNEGSSILVEATVGSSGAILTKIIEGPSAAKSCVGRQIGAVSFPEGSVRQIKLSIDL